MKSVFEKQRARLDASGTRMAGLKSLSDEGCATTTKCCCSVSIEV